MTDIKKLLGRIDAIKYPADMKMIRGEVRNRAFFPGGKGTYDENDDTLSNKDIMILGQDFGTESSFEKVRKQKFGDKKTDATWRNLLAFLEEVGIHPSRCFYTNAIMGVRRTGKIIGKAPAFKDKGFIKQCHEFFLYQLEIQQPKIILVLGKQVAQFISPLFDEKNDYGWERIHNYKTIDTDRKAVISKATFKNKRESTLVLLTHPSLRHVTARHRHYEGVKGVIGTKAENGMVLAALKM
jgi:uracil-DNA glycosylase